MPHEVIMPALGMAQETGKIIAWLKQPGDAVATGDAIMEVETDKATMEVEAQADGFLADVKAGDGDEVPVGQVVALINETADAADAGDASDDEAPGDQAADAVDEAASAPAGDGADLPEGAQVIMPALGMAQDTGLIVAWHKAPGDAVAADEVLLEVETDKSVMEVAAGHDGFVAALLANAQEAVPVGALIAVISETEAAAPFQRGMGDAPAISAPEPEKKALDPGPATAPSKEADVGARERVAPHPGGRILASPKARRLAHQERLDLALLAEDGVAQPYHVADLDRLRTLHAARTERPDQAATAPGPVPMQVAARIDAAGFDAFGAWLREQGAGDIEQEKVWARFAAAAMRTAGGAGDGRMIVEARQRRMPVGRFVDADRSRMAEPLTEDADAAPALILRDFTGSSVSAATAQAGDAPVLTVGRERGDYVITLDYAAGQIGETEAFDLVDGFAERLADPLHHLL